MMADFLPLLLALELFHEVKTSGVLDEDDDITLLGIASSCKRSQGAFTLGYAEDLRRGF